MTPFVLSGVTTASGRTATTFATLRDVVGLVAVDADLEAVVRGLVVGHDGAAQLLDGLLDASLRDLELGLDRSLLSVA